MTLKHIGSMVVYHVTPCENVSNILATSLDPTYAKGRMKAVWFVSRGNIEWAIIHCSVAHHCMPDDLSVCACLVDGSQLHKFFKPGFYYTFDNVEIESATPAMFFLHNFGGFQ